jgi:energy-coupling factor transport system ATP-binding protein
VIEFHDVTVTHAGSEEPTLRNIDLHVPEGELALVIGPTGVGKSTLLGAINGLVPHFTGGTLSGIVRVDGRDTRTHRPRDLADVVGIVIQDPAASFVGENVEEELAYSMEQLGLPPATMRKRVEETLDLLGIARVRNHSLHDLSGGEQQRVAIGAALTAHPRVLVLDEPTSALDPGAAEDVLASITRLVHDLGVTVVMAEHRLERVAQYADSIVEIRSDGSVRHGPPQGVLAGSTVAPPVAELGRLAGWSPLPLSVRNARRHAETLRTQLSASPPGRAAPCLAHPGVALEAERIRVCYGPTVAVRDCSLTLQTGQVVALMGRNGSGKSSLLWALQGSGPRQAGRVTIESLDPASLAPDKARQLVGLVPQTARDLLYLDSVGDECGQSDRDASRQAGTTRQLLDRLAPDVAETTHPRDLSEGQILALALAVQLAAKPKVLLLDEPTRGLDYGAKRSLVEIVSALSHEGASIVLSTHDVEFAALAANRVIVMATGDIITDGPAHEVLVSSPTFAPQIARILAPLPYLTVDDVQAQLQIQPSLR